MHYKRKNIALIIGGIVLTIILVAPKSLTTLINHTFLNSQYDSATIYKFELPNNQSDVNSFSAIDFGTATADGQYRKITYLRLKNNSDQPLSYKVSVSIDNISLNDSVFDWSMPEIVNIPAHIEVMFPLVLSVDFYKLNKLHEPNSRSTNGKTFKGKIKLTNETNSGIQVPWKIAT